VFIKNDELDVFIQVEELLHKKLEQTNGIEDVSTDGEYFYYFNEDDEEVEVWNKYWNIIERLLQQKDKRNKINSARIAEKRKLNKDYARSKKEIENRRK
jgi:hypothetical protein